MRCFAPVLVRHADDGSLLHRRMPHQAALDLDRRDILAARDDDVLETVADLGDSRRGARPQRRRSGTSRSRIAWASRLGVVVIAFHDDVAAHGDLAQRLAVVRHLAAVLVHHPELAGADQLDALARLDLAPAPASDSVPVLGAAVRRR